MSGLPKIAGTIRSSAEDLWKILRLRKIPCCPSPHDRASKSALPSHGLKDHRSFQLSPLIILYGISLLFKKPCQCPNIIQLFEFFNGLNDGIDPSLAITLRPGSRTSPQLLTPSHPDEMTSCPPTFNEKLKANKASKVNPLINR